MESGLVWVVDPRYLIGCLKKPLDLLVCSESDMKSKLVESQEILKEDDHVRL
jgi:hypothetical protein